MTANIFIWYDIITERIDIVERYTDKEIKVLEILYKEKILTDSEIRCYLSNNELKRLKGLNLFNIFKINGVNVYTLNKKSSSIINVSYKEIDFIEQELPLYLPNNNDEKLFKAISFCGFISEANVLHNYPKANIERCILEGYILKKVRHGQVVYELTTKSKKYLKRINHNFCRKNTSVPYADYLFKNYLALPRNVRKSYSLHTPNSFEIDDTIDFFKNGSYIILDIESIRYSFSKNPKIIEIGAIKVINGHISKKFQRLIKHDDNSIPKNITELTGITSHMLYKGVSLDKALLDFIDFSEKLPILAHGIENDWHGYMLNSFYRYNLNIPTNMVFDTFGIINSVSKEQKNGLDALIERYNIDISRLPRHRALNDSIITYLALLSFCEDYKKCLVS